MEDKVVEILNQIQNMAPEVYAAYILQSIIEGVEWLVVPWVIAAGLLIISNCFRNLSKKYEKERDDDLEVIATVVSIAMYICAGIATIVGICTIADAYSMMFNPEYHVYHKIFSAIR